MLTRLRRWIEDRRGYPMRHVHPTLEILVSREHVQSHTWVYSEYCAICGWRRAMA